MRKPMLLILALCLGFSPFLTAHEKPSGSLINPLLKYHNFKALKPFGPELRAFTDDLVRKGYASEIAVYFRSYHDGVWIGVNERKRFAPASLMKVPIMVAYLKEAEKDPSLLSKKLPLKKTAQVSQFVVSEKKLREGSEYTVEELIETMIRDSNNDAMATLVHNANVAAIVRLYDQLGYKGFRSQGDFLPLKAYAGTFRLLYNAAYLNEAMSEKALRLLTKTNFKRGIRAALPAGVKVAHKFGEYGSEETGVKQLHDVGIIYHPDNPFMLGIMTRGADFEKLAQAIEQIAAFIYKEVDDQYKAGASQDFEYKFEEED